MPIANALQDIAMIRRALRPLALAILLLIPVAASAQPIPPAQPTPPAQSTPDASAELLKPEQLEQLVAPIALYPDTLLATVLMASTYPLEVVQADRWIKQNKNLKDDALKAAVDKQPWEE